MTQPRLDPGTQEQATGTAWWSEHAARYGYALQYVRGKRVLDVACGTGYGMAMMLGSAASVMGVDLDLVSAGRAVQATQGDRAGVTVADGCALPFADATFDAVTSFETIEHLERRADFLAELRRVLKPEGLCLLSTPNAHYTLPVEGKPRNPFHVHEYTPEELREELGRYFSECKMMGQVLSPRFRISPFWDDQVRMPKTIRMRTRLLLWRLLNRLPRDLGDRFSHALWQHRLIPKAEDFEFHLHTLAAAPVTVALCRGSA